jgi:hypothetical protein
MARFESTIEFICEGQTEEIHEFFRELEDLVNCWPAIKFANVTRTRDIGENSQEILKEKNFPRLETSKKWG